MVDALKKELRNMNEMWQSVSPDMAEVPDGEYRFQLQGLELTTSSSGKLFVKRSQLIIEGEYEGETIRDNLNIEHEVGAQIFKQFIGRMGFEAPESATDIPAVIEEIAEASPVYTGRLKNKDGFCNVTAYECDEYEGDEVPEEEEEATFDNPDAEAAEIEEEGEEDDISDLIDFAEMQGYEGLEDAEVEDIIEVLKEDAEITAENLADEEIELLAKYGLKLKKPAAKKKVAKKKVAKKKATRKKTSRRR